MKKYALAGAVISVRRPFLLKSLGFLVAGLMAIAFARYIDLPALHYGVPGSAALGNTLEEMNVTCDDARYYCLGDFIDSEWLWQAHLSEQELDTLTEKLGLRQASVDQIGAVFQNMPPYWWRPTITDRVRVLSTPDFPLAGRGQDGWHALATWNPQDNTLHMWIKDNF